MSLDRMVASNDKARVDTILTARVQALHAALKWGEQHQAVSRTVMAKAEEFEKWLLRNP